MEKNSQQVSIVVSNQTTFEIQFDIERFFKQALSLKEIHCGSYDINFVDTETMKEINQTHLKRSYLTDIITFNLGTIENPIGDIYISLDKAKENAKTFNNLFENEIKLLLVHGLLHLLDYRDYTDEEKDIMNKEQERLLELLK